MPWQSAGLDVALEIDPATGRLAYSDVLWLVPRQAGKTLVVGVAGEHRCLTVPAARVWLSAQTGKDAGDWMRDEHVPLLENAPALAGHWRRRMAPSRSAGITGRSSGSSHRPGMPCTASNPT